MEVKTNETKKTFDCPHCGKYMPSNQIYSQLKRPTVAYPQCRSPKTCKDGKPELFNVTYAKAVDIGKVN